MRSFNTCGASISVDQMFNRLDIVCGNGKETQESLELLVHLMERIFKSRDPEIEEMQMSILIASYSIVLMYKVSISFFIVILIIALVDYKRRFIDVEVGWPGSVGDGRVFKNSRLHNCLDAWLEEFPKGHLSIGEIDDIIIEEEIPAFILADSAYANSKHLVTTFKVNECSDFVIAALNKKLGGARYRIEHAFGILKGRFQIFQRPLQCAGQDIKFAIILISACFVLHNFLIDVRDDSARHWNEGLEHEINDLYEDEDINDSCVQTTRDILLKHMRWSLNIDED